MKILFFARAREAAGCAEFSLPTGSALTQADVWTALVAAFPALAEFQKTARMARNETYLLPGELLQPGDEIAVIPPVSGG